MQSVRLISFHDFGSLQLANPLCIVGMPGIADIGKFAVDQLIGIFKADRLCEIIFNDYPAGAIIDDSLLSTPKAEVLFYKDPKGMTDLVFITADAQAMTPRGIYEISDYITTLIYRLGVRQILALGAYPVKRVKSDPHPDKISIYVTATDSHSVDQFMQTNEVKKISKGVIIGANGLIPTLAKARFNIDGIVLLAETDNSAVINENYTDLQGSIQLLELIGKFFHLPIKSDFTNSRITELSQDLEVKRKKLEEELDAVQPYVPATDVDKSLYI